MKRNYFIMAFFLITFVSFAQESPMYDWRFNSYSVELNGRTFGQHQYAASWREQDGYALVNGEKIHYWLYDTYSYHDGISYTIINRVLPTWVEGMGYVIDFDNIVDYNPNEALASSVKALMRQRGCDISVALYRNHLYINNYDKATGIYSTLIYPLRK